MKRCCHRYHTSCLHSLSALTLRRRCLQSSLVLYLGFTVARLHHISHSAFCAPMVNKQYRICLFFSESHGVRQASLVVIFTVNVCFVEFRDQLLRLEVKVSGQRQGKCINHIGPRSHCAPGSGCVNELSSGGTVTSSWLTARISSMPSS